MDAPNVAPAAVPERRKKKPKQIDGDEDSEGTGNRSPRKAAGGGGYNWTAISILILFVLAPIAGGAMKLYDYLYPKNAAIATFRNHLVRCYTSANPKKLLNVESLVKKYGDDERLKRKFWAKMSETYPKVPECHN